MTGRTAQSFGDWPRRQRLKLRLWRKLCLPGTLMMMALWVGGLAVLQMVPLPDALAIALALPVALIPLMIALRWLIPIPDIWDIPAGWVAVMSFLASILLVLGGQVFAAALLNRLFGESPALFPVAFAVATYFGAVVAPIGLIALAVLTGCGLLTLAELVWRLGQRLAGRPVRRRIRTGILGLLLIIGIGTAAILSIDALERVAGTAVKWVALEADFHTHHRCNMQGWPEGVARVAFVGDEQVLGHQPRSDRLVVLACKRRDVLGGATTP